MVVLVDKMVQDERKGQQPVNQQALLIPQFLLTGTELLAKLLNEFCYSVQGFPSL